MGTYFKSADELYDICGKLFGKLLSDANIGTLILKLQKSFKFIFTDYNFEINILIDGNNWKIIRGPCDEQTEIHLWLSSDSAHRLWSGKITPLSAIMSREIRAKGPIRALTEIDTIFSSSQQIYHAILKAQGRNDGE